MTNPILTLRDFWLEVYGGRSLSIPTLKKRIREGKIPGGFRDENGYYMVDMERYTRARLLAVDANETQRISVSQYI